MSPPAKALAHDEWKKYWKVVLGAAAGVSLSSVNISSMGVFIAPLQQQFGWTRTEISSGLMINSGIAVFMSPLAGWAMDRIGPRRIGIVGAILYCCCTALLSLTTEDLWSWWALWVLLGMTGVLVTGPIWAAGVSSFFVSGRGLALAVCLTGTGVTTAVSPVVANFLLQAYGWRIAYQGLAAFWLALTLPAIVMCFTSARDRARSTTVTDALPAASVFGMTARQGLTSSQFIKIFFGTFAIAFVVLSCAINFVPMLQSRGLSRESAVAAAGVIGIGSITGRLGIGYLMDRFNPSLVAALGVSIPVFSSILLIAFPHSVPLAIAAAFILGLTVGAEVHVVTYLTVHHFGLRSFGLLMGVIACAMVLTVGLGPFIVSRVYDLTGSYMPILWAYIPISLAASALFLSLPRLPDMSQWDDGIVVPRNVESVADAS